MSELQLGVSISPLLDPASYTQTHWYGTDPRSAIALLPSEPNPSLVGAFGEGENQWPLSVSASQVFSSPPSSNSLGVGGARVSVVCE